MADGLLNKASIILTPTGYKAGTLYNVAPVVEPYEDFDFARASVASRVNSSGLVEMVGRTLGSELVTNGDFGNGTSDWEVEGSASRVVGTYQGRSNVLKVNILNTATASRIRQPFTYANGTTYKIVVNVYLESGSFRVDCSDSFVSGDFIQTTDTGSWQTLTAYFTAISSGSNYIWLRSSNAVSEFYIDNISVKEIIDTNNIPRISYDSNGDNGHILLEPTSTNLITYSEDFSQWITQNATITSTLQTAPDGSAYVDKYVGSTTNQDLINTSANVTGTFTYSVFVKYINAPYIRLRAEGISTWFNVQNGTIGTNNFNDASIQSFGNGWYRISVTNTTSSTFNNFFILPHSTDNTTVEQDGGSFYVWGAQVEALSYSTSYIPTLTGSTVTRAAETLSGSGNSTLINSTEGVLYAEIAALADSGTYRFISLNDGTFNNSVTIRFDNTSNTIIAILRLSSVNQALLSYSFSTIQFYKIAFKYKANDFALWINGVEVATDTSGLTFSSNTLTQLDFNRGDGSFPLYGKCKAVAVFNEALSDSELTQLTT